MIFDYTSFLKEASSYIGRAETAANDFTLVLGKTSYFSGFQRLTWFIL